MNNQFIRYCLVGGMATFADWGTFYLFNIVFGVYYQIALIFSFAIGSTTNYTLNKFFTFKSKTKNIKKQFTVHLTISTASLLLNMLFMYLLVDLACTSTMLGRVITTVIMLVINYFLHKNITFNKKFFGEEIYV
jgi:putative flippase GtrA